MRRSRSLPQNENFIATGRESIAEESTLTAFPYELLPSELKIVVDDAIIWWHTFIALKSCNHTQRKQLLDSRRVEAWLDGHTDLTHSILSLTEDERFQRLVNLKASYILHKVLYLRSTGDLFQVTSQKTSGSSVEEIELDEQDHTEFTEVQPEVLNAIGHRIQAYGWQLVRRAREDRKKKRVTGRRHCVPFTAREKEKSSLFFLQPIRRNASRLSKCAINHYGT